MILLFEEMVPPEEEVLAAKLVLEHAEPSALGAAGSRPLHARGCSLLPLLLALLGPGHCGRWIGAGFLQKVSGHFSDDSFYEF